MVELADVKILTPRKRAGRVTLRLSVPEEKNKPALEAVLAKVKQLTTVSVAV